jgi:DNA-binding CsgD family transcriptional regulator
VSFANTVAFLYHYLIWLRIIVPVRNERAAMPDVLFEALCATLDHFDAGFVAVFPDGKILHANRMAHEMMAEGWPIQANNGSLQACSKKATTLLLKSLRQVTQTTERSPSDDISLDICLADAASPKGVAIATMKPLLNTRLESSPVAIFVTSIKSRGDCALAAIAECFGLTPAETRTLHHFVEGGTVANAGQALAVSENTVKTHLQNIFAKTRSSRQAQLIKLINDLRPPLRQMTNASDSGDNGSTRFSGRFCPNHNTTVTL